ncbi:hypothetical protein HD806DRAFT_549610 [Xylariaceae sp. AK1471]|nr:hypothetical protein HD806DRAFT_549610 [Xylariaceae sp. AK1471]
MACSECFISSTKKRCDISSEAKENIIYKAKESADFHANCAAKLTTESYKRAQVEDIPIEAVRKVTVIALKRLDESFSDAQMERYHFEELLQIVVGLPLLDKAKLVGKFASKIEQKFGAEEGVVKNFYELSKKDRIDFREEFRKGLKNPSVLDKVVVSPTKHQTSPTKPLYANILAGKA